jgi:hypothetical protein
MLEKLFARLRSKRQGDSSPQAVLPESPLTLTPPPLPADAWAESESGIVITDSGIIILGPDAEPVKREGAAAGSPPAPGKASGKAPGKIPEQADWDDVLARARARAEEASEPGEPPPPGPARAKAK